MNSKNLANLLTTVLVICAVVVTVAVVRREFFHREDDTQGAFPKPRVLENWKDLDHKGNVLGSASAPIRIVTFSDYECPFCRQLDSTLMELRAKYQSKIAIVYRHYPLQIHSHAFPAAVAADCAANQRKFDAYHALLFRLQDSIGKISFQEFARRADVPDTALFDRCMDDVATKDRVRQDVKEAESIGVRGTPAMVVRNELFGGALPLDSIDVWIRRVQPNVLGNIPAQK